MTSQLESWDFPRDYRFCRVGSGRKWTERKKDEQDDEDEKEEKGRERKEIKGAQPTNQSRGTKESGGYPRLDILCMVLDTALNTEFEPGVLPGVCLDYGVQGPRWSWDMMWNFGYVGSGHGVWLWVWLLKDSETER